MCASCCQAKGAGEGCCRVRSHGNLSSLFPSAQGRDSYYFYHYRYEEIAEETFGKLGRLIISSIIYVELFGTCCLLFILEVGIAARKAHPPFPHVQTFS